MSEDTSEGFADQPPEIDRARTLLRELGFPTTKAHLVAHALDGMRRLGRQDGATDAWIGWDVTIPATMQRGPIGDEREVREWVRLKEAVRRERAHTKHEVRIRYVAKRLAVHET